MDRQNFENEQISLQQSNVLFSSWLIFELTYATNCYILSFSYVDLIIFSFYFAKKKTVCTIKVPQNKLLRSLLLIFFHHSFSVVLLWFREHNHVLCCDFFFDCWGKTKCIWFNVNIAFTMKIHKVLNVTNFDRNKRVLLVFL